MTPQKGEDDFFSLQCWKKQTFHDRQSHWICPDRQVHFSLPVAEKSVPNAYQTAASRRLFLISLISVCCSLHKTNLSGFPPMYINSYQIWHSSLLVLNTPLHRNQAWFITRATNIIHISSPYHFQFVLRPPGSQIIYFKSLILRSWYERWN